MADVDINKFRASVVREGSKPASPGFIVSEGQSPTDPAGSGQNHLPVTIAEAATGLSITESQVLGGAGTVGQYIRGDGSLADFPESSGGGSSVSYYLNGSVAQGTIGGFAYKELNKVPILGAGTDFTINADGYIASFITDAGDPNLLEIPGGNWNFETYFSSSSSGGTPSFYVELYKYNGTSFTLLASNSGSPEFIAFGTTLTAYFSTLAVPTTTLALTDRLAVRYYVTHSGRTITLHTEDNHLCQIITTFTTGITALNGLTAQVQNFAVGTSGTDFNIASASATHTFNLPTASATNRGALSSADWTTFNSKTSNLGTVTSVGLSSATSGVTIGSTPVTTSGTITLTIATASGSQNGLLSSTDWTTFNNKANSVAGGYLPLSGGTMTGVITTPNGTFGIIVGDDSRLADRNTANTLFVEGVQDTDRGYINFSETSGNALGAINGGNLTWRGNAVVTGSGTSGQVAYFTGTSAISSESNLFWDSTNDRLGIGNPSPVNVLSIHQNNASSSTTIELTNTSTGNNTTKSSRLLFVLSDTVGTLKETGFVQSIPNDANAVNADLIFGTRTSDNLPSTKMHLYSDGNLFIGSSASNNGAKLQVSGNQTLTGKLLINSTDTTKTPLLLNSEGNYASSGNMTSGFAITNTSFGRALNMGVFESGAYGWIQAAYINNADTTFALALQPRGGNVLIGTTTDNGAKLRVNGTGPDLGVGINVPNIFVSGASGFQSIGFRRDSDSNGGWFIGTSHSVVGDFGIYQNQGASLTPANRISINTSGNVAFNSTTDGGYGFFVKDKTSGFIFNGRAQGSSIWQADNNANNSIVVYSVSQDNYNTAGTTIILGRNSSTSRSINAGGTINASGADYAEYMTKAIEDNIAKGDIVGIDKNGLLTNIFADSISFVVKSTDPSYVGGDTWGNVDIIGKLPNDATDEQKAEHEAKLELARTKVDRIAFSGQVPCNVYDCKVGDYIIPININGKIKGKAVTNPSFEQYQISVGKVWKIMEDGRAWIAVKIG